MEGYLIKSVTAFSIINTFKINYTPHQMTQNITNFDSSFLKSPKL